MRRWNSLPEWLRWILLFPTLSVGSVLAYFGIQLLFGLLSGEHFGWSWLQWWNKFYDYGVIPFATVGALGAIDYAMLYALAPRGHRILGWFWYLLITLWSLAACVLLVIRASGAWGKAGLQPNEWSELSKAISWIVCGSYAFVEYLKKLPSSRASVLPGSPAVATVARGKSTVLEQRLGPDVVAAFDRALNDAEVAAAPSAPKQEPRSRPWYEEKLHDVSFLGNAASPAPAASDGDAEWNLLTKQKYCESRKGVVGESEYAESFVRFRLARDDMFALSQLAGFAWKHVGMTPSYAVEYAMETIFLSRNGTGSLKNAANKTWEAAIRWSLGRGMDSLPLGLECVGLARAAVRKAS